MEIGSIVGNSFGYAKDALIGKWKRWVLLIISSIIFPLIMGYIMEIYRGKTPAPEPTGWVKLFIDGIKFLVAMIIYMIPAIIVFFITIGLSIMKIIPLVDPNNPAAFAANPALISAILPGLFIGLIVTLLITFIISLFAFLGIVRMARTDSFGQAFNFGEISATIGRIGWGIYLAAIIVIWIIMIIFQVIINILLMIPILGWILVLVIAPAIAIFEARYICQLYDAGAGAPPG